MTRMIVIAAASAAALTSCSWMQSMGEKMGFTGPNPKILVDGSQSGPCEARKLKMRVDPPDLKIKIEKQSLQIVWQLQNGYKFVNDHDIPNPAPLGASKADEIHDCHAGGNTMHCTDDGQNKGQWKYIVKLVASEDDCKVDDLDPIISNE